MKKKKTSQNKLKKKLHLENHGSISTKITHSKKMSWVTNLKCCSVQEKKTVQKLLSPPQSKITVKKYSEHNELPHWIKVFPRKKLLFLTNKLNPWSYDQGNFKSVTKYPKMSQSRIFQMLPRLGVFSCEATKIGKRSRT